MGQLGCISNMFLKTAIKYFFLDLALDSLFGYQTAFGDGETLFRGTPNVGDRFKRIVFIDEVAKGKYTYFNCQITDVEKYDEYTPDIYFTFHGFEEMSAGLPTVTESTSGDMSFLLDGTVFLYQ